MEKAGTVLVIGFFRYLSTPDMVAEFGIKHQMPLATIKSKLCLTA